ncbi:inositol-3-phosphate synthase [archaeon]|nr:MAG: inositol-3-phosphate synthase [archaeon]
MGEIRVAIVGVGNCASALVQGVEYYRRNGDAPGLMHVDFGGYEVGDIKFVAAFDVNRNKIGKDLSEAIFAEPNCCAKFADVPRLGVEVLPGPILDGVAPHMRTAFSVYDDDVDPVDVVEVLKDAEADMLINFLPVGSYEGTRFYAEKCLEAGVAFVNCIPEFIASDPKWAARYEKAGIPIAGDDIKSQVGATIVHRALVSLLLDRGAHIDETYQLNIGGNTDFLNMTVEERLKTKRISKTTAVTSLADYEFPTRIGPSDYVPFLGDKKICYIYIKGRKFGNLPLTIDLKLAVEDSPNSAGVVVDVVRAVKLALDRGVAGPLVSVSAYAFKHPPVKVPDDVAKRWVEEFIEGKRSR